MKHCAWFAVRREKRNSTDEVEERTSSGWEGNRCLGSWFLHYGLSRRAAHVSTRQSHRARHSSANRSGLGTHYGTRKAEFVLFAAKIARSTVQKYCERVNV